MKKTCFDRNWSFYLDGGSNYDNRERKINLPHDWSIELGISPNARAKAAGGYFLGGIGVYEKTFSTDDFPGDSQFILEIEGSYLHTIVEINNSVITRNHNGYTSFHANLTDFVKNGENKIKITVDNDEQPNCRWYSGSGLYRHVRMLSAGGLYICPWGVSVRTSDISESVAIIEFETRIRNVGKRENIKLFLEIFDMNKNCVKKKAYDLLQIPQGERTIRKSVLLQNPELWDVNRPYMYNLKVSLFNHDGDELDVESVEFGIRKISFDVDKGFRLNDRQMNLKGGCIHHDNGILGACAYDDAEYRKVKILKEAGYNALRTAHNPPSEKLLEACDHLGILVMDELYDYWRVSKTQYDAGKWFDTCYEKDVKNFVLRDRNHPSIVMWSIGNEIPERDGRSEGYYIASVLADTVRKIDDTRPVTNAICDIFPEQDIYEEEFSKAFYNYYDYRIPEGVSENVKILLAKAKELHENWLSLTEEYCDSLDIVGHNYSEDLYVESRKRFPRRVIFGSETLPQKIDILWKLVKENSHVIGDFSWTAMDYLGEAGLGRVIHGPMAELVARYPWHVAVCGVMDLCGEKKPIFYYRQIVWENEKGPYIVARNPQFNAEEENYSVWGWSEVEHSWSYPGEEGKFTRVEVYADADEVELFLNGEDLGKVKSDSVFTKKFSFENIPYWPGEICAVSWKNGKEYSRGYLKTVGNPSRVNAQIVYGPPSFKKNALCFVTCNLVDEDNHIIPWAQEEVTAEVIGGRLVGMGSSDPTTTENYTSNIHRLYKGKALAVFEMHKKEICIKISTEKFGTFVLRPYDNQ